jgi:molybdenum cofactor cytidylyltransferase
LGRAKQTVVLGGETLVERAARIALEAGLAPVIVVVRPEGDFGQSLQQMGCVVVVNERADEGMAASIRRGVNVAKMLRAEGAVLMTCDQVGLRAEHLGALCAAPGRVTGSLYAGRVGIPAYFPAASFAELLALERDVGARELLRGAAAVADEALAVDVDTEADLRVAREMFREA